jgi:uncharacterized membrane protein YbhN (UPF0104 family)
MQTETAVNRGGALPYAQARRWPLKSSAAVLLGIVSAVALVLALDIDTVAGDLETVAGHPELIAAFAALYTLAFVLHTLAWRALLPSISAARMFNILQVSLFLNHLLPLKAGDVSRIYLADRHGADTADAATSTIVSRVIDLVALLALAVTFSLVARDGISAAFAAPAMIVLVACLALLTVRSATAWLPRLPIVTRFADALGRVSLRQLATALAWSVLSWVAEGAAVFAIVQATGHELSPAVVISAVAFTILFQSVQVTPGGLGVYEASMASALALHGVPFAEGAAIALATHAVKFGYAWSIGLVATGVEGWALVRKPRREVRRASPAEAQRIEIFMARLWNVLNEGKPFTIVFSLGIVVLLSVPHALDVGYLLDAGVALLALTPLALIFSRYAFPLKLRVALWVYLAAFLLLFPAFDLVAIGLVIALYFAFTVVLWGTVYYHLRIGMPWSNFLRFWRLVIENPDTTSGNFLEQAPKVLLVVLGFRYLTGGTGASGVIGLEAFAGAVAVSGVLVHQWFFTWVPPVLRRARSAAARLPAARKARRVILIVIDGCRADRLREADTPFIDRMRREGMDFTDVSTVYPARTVTCFSSMLTGAPPSVHGMASNFVPDLGVKCDSVFNALERKEMRGRLVGIAHLIDAFGDKVRAVSAVMDNEVVDHELSRLAKEVLETEDPDLLVLQLISVDQTGHARGSYNREYLERIEASDRIIQEFVGWCDANGYLDGATVIVTADHGQGIGIGGHGHMSRTEIHVPCIVWGAAVTEARVEPASRFLVDIASTIADVLGIEPPAESVGESLLSSRADGGPVAVIIPARNEAANLPRVLSRIPRTPETRVIVVDDGSTDGTADTARRCGADTVIHHSANRGLGAALRTGLEAARDMSARAAVYLDADGEYDPREIPALIAPIEAGEADYVIGSRYRGQREGQRAPKLLGNLFFTGLMCFLSGRLITDGQSGFRAFSRRALGCAEIIHDYNYAQVLTLDLLKKGMKYREVPITYQTRKHGRSFISLKYLWHVPMAMARQLLRN